MTVIFMPTIRRVEAVEINAGAWYLRALRADERIDDRPALAELGESNAGYVQERADQWATDTVYSWAVCEPTTGEMLAEVTLYRTTGSVGLRARPGHAKAAQAAADAVRRFADTLE